MNKFIKKNKEIIKYALFFFIFEMLYSVIVPNKFSLWHFDEYTYTLYLVDYSFGFCSKFLPGALFHLFSKEVTPWKLNLFLIVLTALFLVFVALILAKIIAVQEQPGLKFKLVLFFLFFLTGPGTFAIITHHLGIYETYWFLLSFAFVFIVSNKYLRYLSPLIFVLSVLIHYQSLFSFVIFFALILLYETHRGQKKEKTIYGILLVCGCLAAIGLSVYLAIFEKANLQYTQQQLNEVLQQRNLSGKRINENYFQSAFFYTSPIPALDKTMKEFTQHPWLQPESAKLPHVLVTIINKIGLYFYFNYQVLKESHFSQLIDFSVINIILLPLLVLFYSYWRKKFKAQKKLSGKLLYALIMLQYPFTLLACFVSTDYVRMTIHAFIIQFVLYVYILYHEKEMFELAESYLWQADMKYLVFYFLVYAGIFMEPV